MVDEIINAERLRRQIGGIGSLIGDGDADARLHDVDHQEAKQQRDDRSRNEPGHGLGADPPDRRRVAHMTDADDQRRKHQRPNDHLDKLEKDRADQRHIFGDFRRRRLVREGVETGRTENNAEYETNHHIDEILVQSTLLRSEHRRCRRASPLVRADSASRYLAASEIQKIRNAHIVIKPSNSRTGQAGFLCALPSNLVICA
jgi:hypothetical protein